MTAQKWLPFNIIRDGKQSKKGKLRISEEESPQYMESISVYGNNSKKLIRFF